MAPKIIDLRRTSRAPLETVWSLLDDSATWPRWTPIDGHQLITMPEADGTGEVRSFRTGRIVVREKIVERVPYRRLSYELLSGLAVRDYRAEIELTELEEGTEIHWLTRFRGQFPGTGWAYRRALEGVTRQFVSGLADFAEQRSVEGDHEPAGTHDEGLGAEPGAGPGEAGPA